MSILLLSQFCFPESDFKCLTFAKELRKAGFDVEILTGYPNYPVGKVFGGYKNRWVMTEEIEGIKIHRVPLYANHSPSAVKRIWNYMSFAFSAALLGPWLIKRPKLIYAYHAPATIAIPAIFLKLIFRSRIVYDINDYWPDTLAATGMIRSKRLIGFIGWYCRLTYKFFDHINVVTQGFKQKLLLDGVKEEKISVIYNWSLPLGFNEGDEVLKYKKDFDDYFTFVYAGNIGKAQGLSVVIEAALNLRAAGLNQIKFILIGDGIEVMNLKTAIKENSLENVLIIPKVSPDAIGAFLRKANVLFLHLLDDPLFKITIPSKLAAYLMVGKPILSGVSGEGKKLLEDAKAGVSFISGDASNLAKQAILLESTNSNELLRLGENGKTFYDKVLSFKKGVFSFSEIFTRLSR